MRYIFRADASREIGSGHVMRISVIAQEALRRGICCLYVGTISDLDWVLDYVREIGFDQIFENFDQLNFETKNDVLIIDSYKLDPNLKAIQKEKWAAVISINDEMTPNFDSDLRLEPSLRVSTKMGVRNVLSGPDFILIRSSITKKTSYLDSKNPRILVVGGGSDPFQFAPEVLKILDEFSVDFEVHYISYKHIESLNGKKFIRHKPGPELDKIANDFDLVLATASTSSFEFIARELPIGVACAVENQRRYYAEIGADGYAIQFGERTDEGIWKFNYENLKKLICDRESRVILRKRIEGLIDMKGASRVVTEIENLLKVKLS